jgi:CHAT domain-containing protein/Tfp pilus assembly protein PilF
MTSRRAGGIMLALLLLVTGAAFSSDDDSADQILAQAKSVYSQQGPKEALPIYERVLAAYRQSGNRLGEAITIGLMGNCYKRLGDYPKALELLNSSLSLKRELHDRLEEGKTLSNLGLVYWEQADYPKAIQVFNESIAIAHELADVQLEASALNNLSLVYDEEGDYRRSLEQYKKALELHRSIKYEPGESDTLGNIGGVFLSLGRFSEAESYYRQALEISRRLRLKPSETQDLGNIAQCQFGEGKTEESLQSFDEAITIAKSGGMAKEEADWYRGKASVLLRVGQFDAALRNYKSSETSYLRAGLKREYAEALTDSGAAFLTVGDRAGAERQIRGAVSISKQIGYERGVVLNQLALAEVLSRSGDQHQAKLIAESALTGATTLGESDAVVQGLLLLGRISRQGRQYDVARNKAELAEQRAHQDGLKPLEAEALELEGELMLIQHRSQDATAPLESAKAIALGTGDVDLLWRTQFHRGQALEQLHRNDEAADEYRSAITTIEDVRAHIAERRFRAGYFHDKQRVYIALVSLLLRMGRRGDAFDVSERLREYSFMQLREGFPEVDSPQLAESKARIRHLQEMLETENLKISSRQRSEAIKTYSDELITAQRDLQALLESNQTLVPKVSTRLNAVQQTLSPHTALLEYVVGQTQLTTFVLRRSGLQAVVTPVRERDLRAKVELLRDLIDTIDSDAWQKPAASLSNLLITPAETKGLLTGITELIVVPHDVLNYLPFAVLHANRGTRQAFLTEEFVIAVAPSAAWLLRPARMRNPDSDRVVSLAPGNSRLKFAIPEAKRVAALFAPMSVMLLGSRATETRLKATADQYDIIHLATHGFFNHTNPLFSGVQLEADDENDGRLEVHEVMGLHLKTRLVTLSACDTALGGGDFSEIPAGDEFVGLSRAFLEAGSEAVLASLWKVNDRSTLTMMGQLYQALKTHSGPQALTLAQRAMIGNPLYRHPFYWAPFVLFGGEPNRPDIVARKNEKHIRVKNTR